MSIEMDFVVYRNKVTCDIIRLQMKRLMRGNIVIFDRSSELGKMAT